LKFFSKFLEERDNYNFQRIPPVEPEFNGGEKILFVKK